MIPPNGESSAEAAEILTALNLHDPELVLLVSPKDKSDDVGGLIIYDFLLVVSSCVFHNSNPFCDIRF